MVEVEMGRHDVAHVVDAEAQIRDLPQRRLDDREPRPRQRMNRKPSRLGSATSSTPSPVSTRMSPVVALDQEAVAAHRRRPERPARAAEQLPPRGHSDPQLR